MDVWFTIHTTPETTVALYALKNPSTSTRPAVVMLHGALRGAGVLAPWLERLDGRAEVVLVDLPCHGRSGPLLPATVEGFARNVLETIRAVLGARPVIVVGESLGGLVALAMAAQPEPAPIRAVLACDPPLTTAKLWNVQQSFRAALEARPDDAALRSFAFEVFGLGEAGGVAERIYYPLLDVLKIPVVVATGDTPLLPPRPTARVACLFDAVDQYLTRRHYPDKVEIAEIPECGHLLLSEAPDACERLIGDLLARHAGPLAT